MAQADSAVVGTVTLCKKTLVAKGGGKKQAKKKQEKKQKKKKEEKKKPEKEKTVKDILASLPKSTMVLDEWKKIYSNVPKNAEGKMTCVSWFENFDWEDTLCGSASMTTTRTTPSCGRPATLLPDLSLGAMSSASLRLAHLSPVQEGRGWRTHGRCRQHLPPTHSSSAVRTATST